MPRRTPLRSAALLALLSCLQPVACGDSPTGPDPVQRITELPRPLSGAEEVVIGAGNRFAFDLAGRVVRPDSNVFVSPLSASMALGMTMNGAEGETWSQMRETLGFGELSEEEIDASYRDLLELLTGLDPSVEIAIGNSVWITEGFPVLASYQDAVREFFDARVETLDFAAPGAAETINAWVRGVTRNLIDGIVQDPIDPDIVVFLINAIYFKGSWTTQFDPDHTAPAPFHLADGSQVEVPTMQARDVPALYARTPDYVAADLPYGGEAFAMTVVVPSEERGLQALVDDLNEGAWLDLLDGLEEVEDLTVRLPRFELEYERRLNEDLEALGMTDAFDPGRADFSRMTPGGGIWVDEVKQKAFVHVNEEGTEAAAVTSVAMAESEPPTLRADRPFLFAIRERLSGTILFLGTLVDPPEA